MLVKGFGGLRVFSLDIVGKIQITPSCNLATI